MILHIPPTYLPQPVLQPFNPLHAWKGPKHARKDAAWRSESNRIGVFWESFIMEGQQVTQPSTIKMKPFETSFQHVFFDFFSMLFLGYRRKSWFHKSQETSTCINLPLSSGQKRTHWNEHMDVSGGSMDGRLPTFDPEIPKGTSWHGEYLKILRFSCIFLTMYIFSCCTCAGFHRTKKT